MAVSARQHLRFTRWRSIRRVLDPRFALVTRRFDIDPARTRIAFCISMGKFDASQSNRTRERLEASTIAAHRRLIARCSCSMRLCSFEYDAATPGAYTAARYPRGAGSARACRPFYSEYIFGFVVAAQPP
jgi:hypothetical protein